MYVGDLMIELSGPFNSGPTASGRMIFNVFPDGTVAEIGGDPVGTVTEAGAITWEQPNTFNFTTGSIADGLLFSQSSTTENTLTRTLTIEAELLGGAFPAGQTFTNQLIDQSPDNGYRDHNQVIAANGGFIAFGKTGAVALSDDGLTWRRSAAPTARDLNAVAFGNGTYLVGGDHGTLFTSTDGVNWIPRNTPFQFNHAITGVAFGDGKFVISSQFSNIATSEDGVVWDVQPTALATLLPGKLRHLDGQFVFWAGPNVRFSADGETWSAPVDAGVQTVNEIARGDDRWIAGGSWGLSASPDGNSWTLVFPSQIVRTVGFGNGRYVACLTGSNGAIHYASGPGATNWRQANAAANGGQSIVFDGTRFVIAGAALGTSTDGISWISLVRDRRGTIAPAQQVFTNSDGSRVLMHVSASSTHPYGLGTFWVGPGGAAYMDSPSGKFPVDMGTTVDWFAAAGEYAGGAGGVIRRFQMIWNGSEFVPQVTQVNSPTTQTLRDGLNFGSQLLMVGDGGTILRFSGNDAISDGPSTSENLRFVGYISTNNNTQLPPLTMVVGDNGTMFVRPANTASGGWVARDTGTTANLVGVAYVTIGFSNNTDARYVAVGDDGTVISSVDSVTWVEESPILSPVPIKRFARVQQQFNYGAQASGDGYTVGISATANGLQSTGGPTIFSGSFGNARVTHGGDRFVMINGDRAYMSFDGRDWQTTRVLGNFRDVAFGGGVFVAVGHAPDSMYYSFDGLDWQPGNHPAFNRTFEAVTYAGGRFLAVGARGFIAASSNGIDWVEQHPNVTSNERVFTQTATDGGNVIVAIGSNSAIISSLDGGETWTQRPDGSSGLSSITYGNGTFVLVGGNAIRRSTDGVTFTAGTNISFNQSSTGSTPEFKHVFFANGQFVATTLSGQAYVSADAITWAERFTGVRGSFTGSTTANGQVLLATSTKVISLAIEDEGSPYVVQQPQDTSVIAGNPFTLNATAIGQGPLTFQWTRNGVPLTDDARITGTNTLTLQINDAAAGDAGQYRLLVTSALGGRTSRAAEVTVVTPPVITTHPQSITAAPDEEVVLSVAADGASLSYQWFKNGALMPGETNASLVIASAGASDAGVYTVEITNLAGSVPSQPAAISISSPPGGSLNLTWSTAFNSNVPELRETTVVLQFGTFPAFALRQLLVQPDGKVLVAGQFEYTGIGGQTRHSLMRLNADGTLDTTFNVPTLEIDGHNSAKYAASIEQVALLSDGRIVLTGGSIQRIGGVLRSAIKSAMLNADGTHVTTFSPSFASNANPYSVAVDSSNRILYAGNNITSSRHIRRFSTAGALDSGFSGASLGHAQAMNQSLVIQSDNKPVYSAYTTDFTGVRTHRTTTGGGIDATFQSADLEGANLWVKSHTPLPDDAFLVNGRFTSVNGTPRTGIARFTVNGELDATFAPIGEIGGTGSVYATAPVAGGFYFSGGQFTTPTALNLAVLRADGSLQDAPAFGSGTNILVNSVAANDDGTIAYAGGNFSTLNGLPVQKVIRFDATATGGGDPLDLAIIALSPGRSFDEGDEVVLTVAATGGNLSYQWFKDEDELPGETAMSLVLSNMTAAAAGSYRVEVSDATGMVPSGDIILTHNAPPANTFANWPALLDLPEDLRGPSATPAGDDVANLIKFAIGVGPLDSAAGRIPQEVLESNVNDETYPVVCFVRDTTVTGVTMQVEVATDLDFTVDLGSTVVSTEDLGGGLEKICVRSNARFADHAKQFFRLKVDEE